VQKTMSVFACYQALRLTDSKKNVYTDNHSGISACQRDSNVSMTDLVSAEDDVNLRVSTSLSAAIDEGRRRRC